jgi:hypothetical protein
MEITNKITRFISRHNFLWILFKPLVKFSSGIQYNRKIHNDKEYVEEIKRNLKDLKVMNGPFKGMIYPNYKSFGSMIFPKLIGSYEKELFPVWNEVIEKKYDKIIDIGSAEGYFTVGLALKSKSDCRVLAVDISQKALEMCKSIAELNGVGKRIDYQLGIDSAGLGLICKDKRCFILCDSEGFEKELFISKDISALKNCDILIETHDSKVFGVSKYLFELLDPTHSIVRINSIDDVQKMNIYDFPELKSLSERARLIALTEGRSNIQEWFYCRSRKYFIQDT